ncbi:MAG TPA: glycosyltransferase [Chthoniobacteraceae bacterium]|nr:glycosyltransferase [Chthoniobacteraceae bacterium]
MLISVVIPTFQRPDSLAACLECLERQRLARGEFEVIVTDDEAGPAMGELFPKVKWTRGPGKGPAANRNHGASLATGEWLAFVDDDCLPAPGWLSAIAGQKDVDVVEGKTIAPGAKDSPFEERVENLRGGSYWSCNLAVRREVFERLGGFDEDFLEPGGEDMEFAWRIATNNLYTRFVPGALVEHPPRAITWKQIWRRTWLIRWIVLYLLKTGQTAPLRASWITVVVSAVKREVAGLLRTSLRFFTEFDAKLWRTRLFQQWWRWVTFPLVLPWLLVWEIRFRLMLRHAADKANAPGAKANAPDAKAKE